MFSSEFCEIFKKTFFVEHLRATASVQILTFQIKIKILEQWITETYVPLGNCFQWNLSTKGQILITHNQLTKLSNWIHFNRTFCRGIAFLYSKSHFTQNKRRPKWLKKLWNLLIFDIVDVFINGLNLIPISFHQQQKHSNTPTDNIFSNMILI